MSHDARAKIRLKDGREVWRMVRYREVGSGRWVSANEVEGLLPEGIGEPAQFSADSSPDPDQIRQQIVDVQTQIALNKQAGAKSTTAARLVFQMLSEMEDKARKSGQDAPWFVLGRQLAEQVLRLVEAENEEKNGDLPKLPPDTY